MKKTTLAIIAVIISMPFGITKSDCSKLKPEMRFPYVLKVQTTPSLSSLIQPKYVAVKTVDVLATGYYGPKKGQPRYRHGNYFKEVFVNGEGKETFYGTRPRIGIVATDPKVFKKGTLMLLKDPRDGKKRIFVAEDTGGSIKGKRIDIFSGFGMEGLKTAEKIGAQKITVQVLKKTEPA